MSDPTSPVPVARWLPALVFSLVACFITWPLVWSPNTLLGATPEYADPYFSLWVLGWDLRTISVHPSWLLTGRIFNAPIFFPAAGALAYSDHEIVQALLLWPLYAVSGNLVLCNNILLLASLVFSAWAMFAFVRTVTGSTAAAWIAGLVWGFGPYRITQLVHMPLQSLYWMPLSFWLLHRLIAGRRTRDAIWLGIVVALQAVSSVYWGVIGTAGLAVVGLVLLVQARAARPLLWRRLALAAVIAALVAAPGLWPFWRAQTREGFGRNVFEAQHNSATLASYTWAPPLNLLYGRSGIMRPGGQQRDEPEKDLFPGFVVLALASIGALTARRSDRRVLVLSMLATGAVGLVLSLGPNGIRPLYATLHDWVFGFQAIRAPARFSVLVFFGLAVLSGVGVEFMGRRVAQGTKARWVTVLAGCLLIAECANGSIAFAAAPALTTSVGRWLRDATEPGPVLYLPIGRDRDDALAMVAALEHGRPILNGFSGQRPALYAAVVDQVGGFPEASALLTLRDLGVRFVAVSAPIAIVQPSPLVERAVYPEGTIYELRWTPDVDAAFDEMERITPPAAGALPFANGESSRYAVRWIGGPMTVPAGNAEIRAERKSDGLQLLIHATTAPWVSRFFEADDTISAETDAQLLPRVYRESLNEGRRRARRTITFEPGMKRVLVINGDTPAVTLPLRRDARDPLSALFYARTLPLADRFHIDLPVNDAGRNTVVALTVTGVESIEAEGRQQLAWKVEPTLVSRLAWRDPPRATAWLSHDDRKLPLRIRVSGSFGVMDVELLETRSW